MRRWTPIPHLVRTMSVKPPMGTGQRAPRGDRRGWEHRSSALRRHPCASTGEIGRDRRRQASRTRARRTAASASPSPEWRIHGECPPISFRPTGWPSISMRPISPSSMPPGICPPTKPRRQGRISDEPHSRRAILRHRRDLPTLRAPCPICCRRPRNLPRACARWASATARRSSCYDTVGLFSAARAWWMFRVFGHDDVAVLDGGLPKWKAKAVRSRRARRRSRRSGISPPRFQCHDGARQGRHGRDRRTDRRAIADARSPGRFRAEEPEPRPGVRGGHMPGARNVHYATLLNPDGTLKPRRGDRAKVFRRRRRRCRQAGHHDLRLGHHGRDPDPRPRPDRPQGPRAL